jgi:thioredoxin-dependent peroxiredoxin
MRFRSFRFVAFFILLLATNVCHALAGDERPAPPATRPSVGNQANDFTLNTLNDQPVRLAELTKNGPVVLVVLRGWVGYQCPICNRQVGDLIGHAQELTATGASIVLVYPGPADNLKSHAQDFITGKTLPEHFYFVIDPMMTFVSDYGLRWDAAGENAYPATFVIGTDGKIMFAKISQSHGDRATAAQILAAMPAPK